MKRISRFLLTCLLASLLPGFTFHASACTFGHVGFTYSDINYHEKDGLVPIYLTFNDSGSCNGSVTITVHASSTAHATNDYTSPPITFGFPCSSLGCVSYDVVANQTAATYPVNLCSLVDNNVTNAAKTIVVTISQTSLQTDPNLPTSTTIHILDDDFPVTMTALDPMAYEEGRNHGSFLVTREGDLTYAADVNFTRSGTATYSTDYTLSANGQAITTAATIPAGSNSVVIEVIPVDDALQESSETVTLTLGAGYYNSDPIKNGGTVTIIDNDPVVTIAATDPDASESGDSGLFTVFRTADTRNPLTVLYSISGTASNGVDYAYLSNTVVIPAGEVSATITVAPIYDLLVEGNETVILTLKTNGYVLDGATNATVTISDYDDGSRKTPVISAGLATNAHYGRFARGTGTDPGYQSFLVTVDFQQGVALANTGGNGSTLFPGLSWSSLSHYDATNNSYDISFQNPIAAFGSRVGGSPLFFQQNYTFGVYAGDVRPYYTNSNTSTNALRILVYDAGSFALVGSNTLTIPNISDTNEWRTFLTNGYSKTLSAYGLSTTLSFDNPFITWSAWSYTSNYNDVAYHLTHKASATNNYIYEIELAGGTDKGWMVKDGSGNRSWSRLYTLEFEERPEWRSLVLRQPQFFGSPMPPGLAGKSAEEFLTNGPPVNNAVVMTNSPTSFTVLDQSPELRMHPTLDQFVADMGNDPIALANYVLNEIELTDAIDYNDNGVISETSINLGGVNRGALGVFLEGQGSPTEQCALLVYLLRKAGYPALYLFPPHNGLKMVDARLSKLLRTQIHNAVNAADSGNAIYTSNQLIPVNYPWVGLYLTNESRWVHIFPWLKDTQIEEQFNLYDFMPAQYDNAFKWARAYMYGETNILSLSPQDDSPLILYPKFIEKVLRETAPELSLDDLGVRAWNRRNYFARWSDFPVPTSVVSSNIPVESLGSSMITNVSPALTNIFNTLSVEVSSLANPNTKVSSGEMRLAELHNRRLVAWHTRVATNNHTLTLSLAAFRTNITAVKAFASDGITNTLSTNSIVNLTTNVSLGGSDDDLKLTLIHKRHRAMPGTFSGTNFWTPYLGFSSTLAQTNVRFLRKGDLAAICVSVGRATRKMLDQHAIEIWQMERAGVAGSMDRYQGSVAYLMGMSYFEKQARFNALVCRLHKAQPLANLTAGLAMLRAKHDASDQLPNGNVILVQPALDMVFQENATVGDKTIHLDSGDDGYGPHGRVFELGIVGGSALEHNTLNRFFEQSDSISTTRLLQFAASSNAVIVLTRYNYVTEGDKTPAGSATALKSADPTVWNAITNTFAKAYVSNNVVAFVTPGKIYNATRTYYGMGAMVFSPVNYLALIGDGFNGAYSPPLDDTTLDAATITKVNLQVDEDNTATLEAAPFVATSSVLTPEAVAAYDTPQMVQQINASTTFSQPQFEAMDGYKLLAQDANTARQTLEQNLLDAGALDKGFRGNHDEYVMDPVNVITGEFYHDAVDLSLHGRMRLEIRRNYSSQNEFDSEFGVGWKMSYAPSLTVSKDTTNALLYSAEVDGSVLAYRRQTNSAGAQLNVWRPTTKDNPRLQNLTGSVGNLFNSSITRATNGTNITYTQVAADGSTRIYKPGSYPLTYTSTTIQRSRPYLDTWADSAGNYLKFAYGPNAAMPEYGKVCRIESSSGNFVGFNYDVYGHIIEAWSGDGKRLYYEYDEFGDLVGVTLPDASGIGYEYQHQVLSTNSTRQTYSTHLLIREEKPEGRLLVNDYDRDRRVINQYATVGQDFRPLRNASFVYSNNFRFTNSFTNLIAGYTLVTDYATNTTRYDYANSLVTLTADPLSRTSRQTWYAAGDTNAGAYAGSLKSSVDARGLLTQFLYDTNGNATTVTVIGDITGAGNTNETAVRTFAYNANQLLTSAVDAVGNRTAYTYTNPISPFLRTSEELYASNGTSIAVSVMDYYSVTNAAVLNNFLGAVGVPHRIVRAANWIGEAATNDLSYDAHGFLTNEVRHTGTTDPDVVMNYVHNLRGELIQQTDAAGRATLLSYTPRGDLQSREILDESANRLSLEAWYYNQNGELEWYDGPRWGAEDYAFYERDGAGRVIEEDHARSRAKQDGTGVEPETDGALFAATFHEYDPFNNRVKTIDPRGHYLRMRYDAMGQMIGRSFYDGNAGTGATPLATEGFAYEPGGLLTRQTNALGGIAQTLYTSTGQPCFQSNADGSTNGWLYYLDGRPRREVLRNGSYFETTFDDANLRATRIFYNSANAPLATNVVEKDHRGNAIRRVDEGGFTFTNSFDRLDRIRIAYGPQVIFTNPPGMDFPAAPPPMQMAATTYYDAAGIYSTNVNALGEKTVRVKDALGRTTHLQIYSGADGSSVRVRDLVYAPDHQSVTVWEGTGTNTIASVRFSDTDGHEVLALRYPNYPSSNVVLYALQTYDVAGNRTGSKECSWSNGVVTVFATNFWTIDALNRPKTATVGDGATTTNAYDGLGDVTEQALPGNLRWRAGYNAAGQMTNQYNLGADGSTVARLTTCGYYPSGNLFAGMLWTCSDGRGITTTNAYDDFLRLASLTRAGAAAEQKVTTSIQYDARSLPIRITESFADTNTGPATVIANNWSAYAVLLNQSVSIGGKQLYSAGEGWDAALRRVGLTMSGTPSDLGYAFGWRADGLLASTAVGQQSQTGAGIYSYTDAGLLQSRIVGTRQTTINLRDGAGRILALTASMFGVTKLTETLTWRDDDLLLSDTQTRADFTDSRSFGYANATRRLTEEALNLDGSTRWTNTLGYDKGQSAGPGVLTKSGNSSGSGAVQSVWTSNTDPLLRVSAETNTAVRQVAQGRVNGPATLTARLDGGAQPVVMISTSDTNWPVQWRANLEVSPGSHTIQAEALLPSGMFSTNASNTFTCAATNQILSASFDGGGFVTNRTWKLGTNVVLTQTLTWDGKGRLFKASVRDSSQSGVDWTAVYDGLDRLLRTTEFTVTNGLAITNQPSTIDHYYDPEHEFLELGVNESGHVTWKVLGPDTDGTFGGQNGTGGFEAIVPGPELYCPIISDVSGNLLGVYDPKHAGLLNWFPSRKTGYGAVPGLRPVPLGQAGADLGEKSAWRNRWMAGIGLVYMGANWYDPVGGQFLSPDSDGHASSPNLYAFCHGNPWGYWDADGRMGVSTLNAYGRSDHLPFEYRLAMIQLAAGLGLGWEELGYGVLDHRSFAAKAGSFAADTLLNAGPIRESWYELTHPDFSSGWGRAAFGTAVIGLPANIIDAAANVIPGKALVEDVVKGGIKGVAKLFVKDSGKELLEVGSKRGVVQFGGMEVRAVRDLSHMDESTLRAMAEHGFAAETKNGEKIALHHLEQNPAGPVVEMPRGNNDIANRTQHPFGNQAGAGLSAEQRAAFDTWREDYWRARATAELQRRGLQ